MKSTRKEIIELSLAIIRQWKCLTFLTWNRLTFATRLFLALFLCFPFLLEGETFPLSVRTYTLTHKQTNDHPLKEKCRSSIFTLPLWCWYFPPQFSCLLPGIWRDLLVWSHFSTGRVSSGASVLSFFFFLLSPPSSKRWYTFIKYSPDDVKRMQCETPWVVSRWFLRNFAFFRPAKGHFRQHLSRVRDERRRRRRTWESLYLSSTFNAPFCWFLPGFFFIFSVTTPRAECFRSGARGWGLSITKDN